MKTTHRFFRRPAFAIATLAAALFAGSGLHADTIILKNGTRYQGRVLKDEGNSYLLEIQVTRTIKDERRVLKSEIEKIEKANPIAEDFKPLEKLDQTPDMLDAAGYQARINKVKKFLAVKEYKFSKQYKAARKILAHLETEQKTIKNGGIKINGRLISAEQRKADAVAIDGEILYQKMYKAAIGGKLLAALRIFESIEKNFPQTATQKKATSLARKVLVAARKQINRSLETLDQRLKERENNLQRMSPTDRARNQQLIDEQKARYQAILAKERQERIKWLTIDNYDRQSLQDTLRRIDAETRRLGQPPYNRLKKAPDVAYREAWKALPGAGKEDRTRILAEFKQLNLPDEKYLKALEERADQTPAPSGKQPAAK